MRRSITLLVAFALTALLGGPSAGAAPATPLRGAADEALVAARALFVATPAAGVRPPRSHATAGGAARRDATLVLRDLLLALPRLTPGDREAAGRLLARPTDGADDPNEHGYDVASERRCLTHTCVHWVESTADAPNLTDANADGVADWVATTGAVLENVWDVEVTGHGYRAPRSDATSDPNGDARLDVYLADLGARGLYGYCTSDDPRVWDGSYPFYDASAYCVLDDDFSLSQFPAPGGLGALQVTAAHELFHAVQFGYDYAEDAWLMEGTAAWMEDEVYDAVDDNRQYFARSPLRLPQVALDYGDGGHEYGAWVFWRYLSERFGPGTASDPTVVRDVWRRADGSPVGRDAYSLQAVNDVLVRRGATLRGVFRDFATASRYPSRVYEEGARYPVARPVRTVTLGPGAPRTPAYSLRLRHLASGASSFVPGRGAPAVGRLRIDVDLPSLGEGPEAIAVVVARNGTVRYAPFRLDLGGRGAVVVPFSRTTVARVDLVLANASGRFACWRQPATPYSCAGAPADDHDVYVYRAGLTR